MIRENFKSIYLQKFIIRARYYFFFLRWMEWMFCEISEDESSFLTYFWELQFFLASLCASLSAKEEVVDRRIKEQMLAWCALVCFIPREEKEDNNNIIQKWVYVCVCVCLSDFCVFLSFWWKTTKKRGRRRLETLFDW